MFNWLRKSPALSDTLGEKTLIMIVGPSAVGKTALINEVVRRNPTFGKVTSFTSRRPRPDDEPGLYRYISRDAAEELLKKSEVVQYAIHPTTNMIYGSTTHDYPKPYNLLDTLSSVVVELESLPFKQTLAISITSPVDQWRNRFLSRYPGPSDEALKRLAEARSSIEWSLAHPKTLWIINSEGELNHAARQLIELAQSASMSTPTPTEPHEILKLIKGGLWN